MKSMVLSSGPSLSVYQSTPDPAYLQGSWPLVFQPALVSDQEAYMQQLIGTGFKVIITGVFSAPFDETWPGRTINPEVIATLKAFPVHHRIMLTGEGGSMKTLVLDAPFFTRRIVIDEASTEYRNNRGIFRIRRAHLEDVNDPGPGFVLETSIFIAG